MFFDLPVATIKDRREYSRFRRFLIKNGFIMLQESVYCKLAQNQTVADSIADSLRKKLSAKWNRANPDCNRKAIFEDGIYNRQ